MKRNVAAAVVILNAICVLITGCEDYPKDVRHTLDSVQSGVLHVGLVENAPWVIRGPAGPQGLEPDIIRTLAARLDAEVAWHWGSTAVVLEALEQYQVHLAAGGFATGPLLPSTVAATNPYYVTRYTVGFLPSQERKPTQLEGLTLALPLMSPLHEPLKKKNAELRSMTAPEESGLPMAGPTWWLEAHGYAPGPWTLLKQKQVMVVTKGENAWMTAVQRHLNGLTNLDEELRQLETQQ